MDDIRNPHRTQNPPSPAGPAAGTGRPTWRGKVRNAVLGIAAAATIAVGGAGMINAQEASAAGVPNHNYAVLTQTVHVPGASAEPKDDD